MWLQGHATVGSEHPDRRHRRIGLSRTVIHDTTRDEARGACGDSAAFELRLARRMLDEVPHADVTVTGREDAGELHPLDLQAGIEIDVEAPVDGLLGRADGVCRAAHVALHAPTRRGIDLLRRDNLVHQTDRQGFFSRHEAPGEDDVLGPGRTDQPRQPLGATGARNDAEQHLRLTELGVLARNPEVTGEGELTAGTERVTGDGGHGGLGDPGDRDEGGLQRRGTVDHVRVGHGLHLLDVSACRKDLLAAVDDDRGDVLTHGGFVGRGGEAILNLEVERVHGGAVQTDGADATLDLELNDLTHDCSVSVVSPCARPIIVSCHKWTADSTSCVVTTSSPLMSVSGPTTCSPVTTRVSFAMPALTTLRRRVSSLQAMSRVRASCGTSSPICHCPNTRMTVKSPSMQRTNSCWSCTVKATSPSSSMLGPNPSSIRASSTRPRRGCSLGGGGKLGSEVGSVMCIR